MNLATPKTLLVAALTAAFGIAAGSVQAVPLNDFQFDPLTRAAFTADKIVGNYAERVTFDGVGGFNVSIIWNASQFATNDGIGTVNNTGINNDYQLYATYTGSGTVSGTAPNFVFNLNPGGVFNLYYDDYINTGLETTFADPGTGNSVWTLGNNGDDILLGSGVAVSGVGDIGCIDNNQTCGKFAQTTTLNLTAAGKTIFIQPIPFYNLSFESGQFNGFDPSGNILLNGSLDTIFKVPEPASLALLGLGLVGIGLGRRARRAQH